MVKNLPASADLEMCLILGSGRSSGEGNSNPLQYSCLGNPMNRTMPGSSVLHYLSEFAQIHVHGVVDATLPSHPLSPRSFAFNLSQHQGLFQCQLALCIRWLKYWSFSFSISPSNEYSGLISFRIDSFDLFTVQGTLKSLLQHHSSKASILVC